MSTDVQIIIQDIDIEKATNWSEEEFIDVDLGDKRRDERLVDIAVKIMAQPLAPINQACDDWADTKASYRLFRNEKVTAEKILYPHQNGCKTIRLCWLFKIPAF